jgi:hypothetical protein
LADFPQFDPQIEQNTLSECATKLRTECDFLEHALAADVSPDMWETLELPSTMNPSSALFVAADAIARAVEPDEFADIANSECKAIVLNDVKSFGPVLNKTWKAISRTAVSLDPLTENSIDDNTATASEWVYDERRCSSQIVRALKRSSRSCGYSSGNYPQGPIHPSS